MKRLLALSVLAALLPACAAAPARPRPPAELTDADYPGELRPPSAFGADVLLRQRITATWGDHGDRAKHDEHDKHEERREHHEHGEHGEGGERARSFEGVFQKQGDTLTILGLSPLGQAGFVVQLLGDRVTFENRTDEELPFPPRFILLDVQRAFFPWLAAPGETLPDGVHEGDVGGEHVVETWKDGRLAERRFTRLDGRPAGTITIRCPDERADRAAPAHVVLDNAWLGYRLTIDTFEETPLQVSAPARPR